MYPNREHVLKAGQMLRNNDKIAIGKQHIKFIRYLLRLRLTDMLHNDKEHTAKLKHERRSIEL